MNKSKNFFEKLEKIIEKSIKENLKETGFTPALKDKIERECDTFIKSENIECNHDIVLYAVSLEISKYIDNKNKKEKAKEIIKIISSMYKNETDLCNLNTKTNIFNLLLYSKI